MSTGWPPLLARIPGHGRFVVTADAAEMIGAFGGVLHCYEGPGGCRKRGLYFSRTSAKKALDCALEAGGGAEAGRAAELRLSVSAALAGLVDGATLDFRAHTGRQRFVWSSIPALRTPPCTCLRSVGAPAGRRSPCLDDRNLTFDDL